jgi:hypothetical protein
LHPPKKKKLSVASRPVVELLAMEKVKRINVKNQKTSLGIESQNPALIFDLF